MKAATLRIPRSALALLLITVLLLLASTAWAGPRIKRASPPPQPAAEDDASTAEPEPFLPEVLVSEASFDPTGLELGMRFGSTSAFDDWVDSDGTADYGGLGFIFRWRFDPDWAVGLAVDFFARYEESGRLDETRVITDLFVSYFLSSPDWFQLYLPFGLLASNNV
ncbi:MAG: hypothetical protein RBU37_26495, partial [Myxococcota bacterium]|nr:hypothetical protein [Myxococcota bacterium]